jgi:hypothetical protein
VRTQQFLDGIGPQDIAGLPEPIGHRTLRYSQLTGGRTLVASRGKTPDELLRLCLIHTYSNIRVLKDGLSDRA